MPAEAKARSAQFTLCSEIVRGIVRCKALLLAVNLMRLDRRSYRSHNLLLAIALLSNHAGQKALGERDALRGLQNAESS